LRSHDRGGGGGCWWRAARRGAGWYVPRIMSSSRVRRGRLSLGVGGSPTEQVLAVTVRLFVRVVMRRVRVRIDGSLRRHLSMGRENAAGAGTRGRRQA